MEFEQLYKQYQKALTEASGGFVEASKADLLKMIVFHNLIENEKRAQLRPSKGAE